MSAEPLSPAQLSAPAKPLGFWSCWALAVGTMIGSGVLLLPAVLAPYGLLSFGGWVLAGGGSMMLALALARLAARTVRSGGMYVYAREAFGDLVGFLVAWAFQISYLLTIPVVTLGFVGYLGVLAPTVKESAPLQAATGVALIAVLTLVNIKGLKEASLVQIAMTALKITPLAAVALLACFAGDASNLPAFNPTHGSVVSVLAATALITLWPFTGFEAATLPAGDVADPQRTIPRALIVGVITVTVIYLSATAAVMWLVPTETLTRSTAPFADAARGFGAWGPQLVAFGALVATAGTLNGAIFVCGQMPMSVARDGLAPAMFARVDAGGAPYLSLLLSSALGAALLLLNYSRGLIGAFTFLLMMSTALTLFFYLICALAEVRQSWRSAPAWATIALIGVAYSIFAVAGSGLEVTLWGLGLIAVGAPLFYLSRKLATPAPDASPTS